ncbi:MAG TPA: hypothetical protein VLX58_07650 [Bryobacteraceae bacterium]|nr:hypothetical protein [Bryobacteraceae bacterium]
MSNQRTFVTNARVDSYTKAVLTSIALLLGMLALRPLAGPLPVQAQSETPALYIEPGITDIRNSDGGVIGQGKIVIDLRTGEVWGFPMTYTATIGKPPTLRPLYQGRYDFSAMKRTP